MNINWSQLLGLVTHPWAPLVGVVPVLCVGYLLLVRPIVGQLGGIELTEVTSDPAPDPHKLAPIYVFASAEQVLPWLGQHAQTTGVLLREVTQWPDQLGLTIRLEADFPSTVALVQRLFHGSNLVIEPTLNLQPSTRLPQLLQVDLQLRVQALACLEICASAPLGLQVVEPLADAFAITLGQSVGVHSELFFGDAPAASLQWVGRLRRSTQVYDLVRDPQGQVLLFGKDARFGQEQIDAAHLLGWVDDAR